MAISFENSLIENFLQQNCKSIVTSEKFENSFKKHDDICALNDLCDVSEMKILA